MQRADALVPVVRGLRAVAEEHARTARVARQHLDVLLERRVADLREPEAMLLDEVDGEAVAAGRDRAAQRELLPQRLARSDGALERRARAVPDDRVAALVEPVVREERARPRRPRVRQAAEPAFSTSTVACCSAPASTGARSSVRQRATSGPEASMAGASLGR